MGRAPTSTLTAQRAANVLQAARLRYVQGKTQTAVGHEMNATASAVSQWLQEAEQHRIVRHVVLPPPLNKAEEDLLSKLRGRGLTRVAVVPPGSRRDEKNTLNLGMRAAELIVEHILDLPGDEIAVAISCGTTVRQALLAVIEILRYQIDWADPASHDDPDGLATKFAALKHKKLILYPTTFMGGYEVNFMYPHTLVTMLHVELIEVFKEIVSYTPSLPKHFYDPRTTKQWRNEFLEGNEINSVLGAAKQADIFISGVGVLTDKSFKAVSADIGRSFELPRLDANMPEICYSPIAPDGSVPKPYADAVIGIKPGDLHNAAQKGKWVLAIAGGAEKSKAMKSVLKLACLPLNVLVTDLEVCEAYSSND